MVSDQRVRKNRSEVVVVLVSLLACVGGAGAVFGGTLGFDDLTGTNGNGGVPFSIPDGYGGLHWEHAKYLHLPTWGTHTNNVGYMTPGYGFTSGAVSPDTAALFEWISQAGWTYSGGFSSDVPITFESVYLTAGFMRGLQVVVQGFLGNAEVNETTVTIDIRPNQYRFNWSGIDRVAFTPVAGTGTFGLGGGYNDVILLDDLRYTTAAPVPLPAAAWMGFALLGAVMTPAIKGRLHVRRGRAVDAAC